MKTSIKLLLACVACVTAKAVLDISREEADRKEQELLNRNKRDPHTSAFWGRY